MAELPEELPDLATRVELRDLAVEVAREAAVLVRERRRGDVSVAATKTTDTDVVTEVDRASEALIVSLLASRRPDDGVMGEEGADSAGRSGVRWVIDPIDGTVNFLYGIPHYAVSIAAEVEGRVVAGTVVEVATGVEYAAVLGAGSTRDGVPLRVREPAPLHQRLVLTGFGYDPGLRAVQSAALARLLPRIRDIRRLGSCALDLCRVADGSADGYLEEGAHLWDYAAGALVATEAGAQFALVEGAGGGDLILCAPTHGFAEFRLAATEAGFLASSSGADPA